MPNETLVALGEDYPELRESVRKICAHYPGSYWSGLEEKEACLLYTSPSPRDS